MTKTLPNEYLNSHKYEKRNMSAKCKIFVNVTLNFLHGHLLKQICLPNKKHLSDHRCERTHIAT